MIPNDNTVYQSSDAKTTVPDRSRNGSNAEDKAAKKVHSEDNLKVETELVALVTETQEKDEMLPLNQFSPASEEKSNYIIEDDDNVGQIEDARLTKFENSRLQLIDMGTLVLSIAGFALSLYEYDVEYDENPEFDYSCKVALGLIFVLAILHCILLILRYIQKNNFLKARNEISNKSPYLRKEDRFPLIVEILITMCIPMPWFQNERVYYTDKSNDIHIFYHLNDLMCVLMLLRVYIFVRVIVGRTEYFNTRAQRVCSLYGADTGVMFPLKCLMRNESYSLITICMVVTIAMFGYALRICEKPVCRDHGCTTDDLSSYWNSMWNVIVTMTTVGYGDFYPRTIPGRAVTFFLCIWGVFLVSMMVVTLSSSLMMSSAEVKAIAVLGRLTLRKRVKNEAAFLITRMTKHYLLKKKPLNFPNRYQLLEQYLTDVKEHAKNFRHLKIELQNADDGRTLTEEIRIQHSEIKHEIEEVRLVQGALSQLCRTVEVSQQNTERMLIHIMRELQIKPLTEPGDQSNRNEPAGRIVYNHSVVSEDHHFVPK
jgi:potassium intermediate/small conductance calcium-activated channel subfamily N protein 2